MYDSVACLSEDDLPIKNAKKEVKVKFQQNVDQILNSLSWEKKTINKHWFLFEKKSCFRI